jgi:hypothetical protein
MRRNRAFAERIVEIEKRLLDVYKEEYYVKSNS